MIVVVVSWKQEREVSTLLSVPDRQPDRQTDIKHQTPYHTDRHIYYRHYKADSRQTSVSLNISSKCRTCTSRQRGRLSMPRWRPSAGQGDAYKKPIASNESFEQVGFKRGNGLPLPRGSRELQPGYLAMPRVQVDAAVIIIIILFIIVIIVTITIIAMTMMIRALTRGLTSALPWKILQRLDPRSPCTSASPQVGHGGDNGEEKEHDEKAGEDGGDGD